MVNTVVLVVVMASGVSIGFWLLSTFVPTVSVVGGTVQNFIVIVNY